MLKRKFDFSIDSILNKKIKCEEEVISYGCHVKSPVQLMTVKIERPESRESPSSTTSFSSLESFLEFPPMSQPQPTNSQSSPSSTSPSSSSSSSSFPQWTQCQRDGKKSRRPYSRQTVTILSWWFHHLPFLTVEEMEMVGGLTGLSRQQVKVWWQNRRHSQRGRSDQADPYLGHILHLPLCTHHQTCDPGSGYRQAMFRDILTFYCSRVRGIITPGSFSIY